MRHFSTLICILALGLAIEMGTSCTKQTIPPVTNNAFVKGFKATAQDTTTSQPSTEHHCGGSHSSQG